MKKKIFILSITILVIIISSFFINNDGIKLTDEERQFIEENRDSVFLVGYYNTPSESLFAKKLCEKIGQDTALKLKPIEDTWDNNLNMLKNGSIPILINMNKTKNREEFCYFTTSLEPLSTGIYSSLENKIDSYNSINGKVLAIEKGVSLLNDFRLVYPQIKLNDKIIIVGLPDKKVIKEIYDLAPLHY